MNTTDPALIDLLAGLQARGIALAVEGGALKVSGRREALTPELRTLLARERDALLAHLQAQDGAADEEFPLTDVQQAYWVGRAGLELGGVGCHAYREFRAPAGLDLSRLEQAWQSVVARHEMLRAIVTAEGRMRVLPQVPPYAIELLDLRGAADGSAQLAQLRARMSHQVFDPARWPLFEIRATRTDDGVLLHVGMDLLVADAASMLQLYREWSSLYADPNAALEPPPRRFAEFVREQQSDAAAQARAADYWQARLDRLPGPPALPVLPREAGRPTRFVRHARTIEGPEWARLVTLARGHGLTPSNLLLAAYADVLAAFSSRQHFLLTLTAFHVPAQYAGVVGDFTTTLLLEVDARAAQFLERARALQRQLANDLEHTGWSGVRVARELARRQGTVARPVPVVFTSALGHAAAGERRLPLAWLGETVHAITQTPQVWIDHHVIEDGDRLHCSWDVLEDVLPGDLVEAMVDAHARLLHALARDDAAWLAPLGTHLPQAQRSAPSHGDLAALALQGREPGIRPGDASTRWVRLGEPPADTSAWRRRASVRSFAARPVPLAALAALLAALVGVRDAGEQGLVPKRRYPSGGSLYAVQCWVLVEPGRVEGLPGGLYCHHPLRHALEPVAAGCAPLAAAQFDANRAPGEEAAFALLLVAQLDAVEEKYGPEAARALALVEAGYIGQLLMEQAPTHGLGLCPIAGMDDAHLPAALELGSRRPLVHALLGGLPRDSSGNLPGALQSWLTQQLPVFMVADSMMMMGGLPLTANGEVDGSRLPQPATTTRTSDQFAAIPTPAAAPASLPARDALEDLLRQHFAEVLGLARVPLDTGIVELGGTSLHVVRLHRALEKALGRPLDLMALFQHPSVSALARWLQSSEAGPGTDA